MVGRERRVFRRLFPELQKSSINEWHIFSVYDLFDASFRTCSLEFDEMSSNTHMPRPDGRNGPITVMCSSGVRYGRACE